MKHDRPHRRLIGLSIGISLLVLPTAVCAAADAPSTQDSVLIEIHRAAATQWTATVYLRNTGNVSAMTFPFRWNAPAGSFRLDSVSYVDSRSSYFAVKTFYPDTAAQTILLGMISDLGRGLPPLDPGRGPVARLHFTALGDSMQALSMDTTFIPPHNVLQMVTPDIRALYPNFRSTVVGESVER